MMRPFLFLLLSVLFARPAAAENAPAWWEAAVSQADVRLPLEKMQKTLADGYALIAEKALTPVTAHDLAFESVKSLSTIDQKIVALKDGSRVLILADGKILKSFSAPTAIWRLSGEKIFHKA